MAVTYTWEITSLRTRTEGENLNAVVQTYWKKTGTDENGNSGTFDGATPFSAASVPVGEFIAFEQLTEETVLNWIKSVVVGDYEQHVNARIQDKINSAATSQPELPWAPGKGTASIAEAAGEVSVADPSLKP
jgi:hypothetical protein